MQRALAAELAVEAQVHIEQGERAITAARRVLRELAGLIDGKRDDDDDRDKGLHERAGGA